MRWVTKIYISDEQSNTIYIPHQLKYTPLKIVFGVIEYVILYLFVK